MAKDDSLGLGATGSSESASRGPTGLDSLQHLFGRLNGKTEAKLEAEQQSRNDLTRRNYVNRRWGSLHFVSAGLLQKDAPPVDPIMKKAISEAQSSEFVEQEQQPLGGPDTKPEAGLDRCVLGTKHEGPGLIQDTRLDIKARRTEEKAQRRQERAKRKEAKKLRKVKQRQQDMEPSLQAPVAPIDTKDVPKETLRTHSHNARHGATRFRYIQQKKMAITDAKALNEVSQIFQVHLAARGPILIVSRYSCCEHKQVAITILSISEGKPGAMSAIVLFHISQRSSTPCCEIEPKSAQTSCETCARDKEPHRCIGRSDHIRGTSYTKRGQMTICLLTSGWFSLWQK